MPSPPLNKANGGYPATDLVTTPVKNATNLGRVVVGMVTNPPTKWNDGEYVYPWTKDEEESKREKEPYEKVECPACKKVNCIDKSMVAQLKGEWKIQCGNCSHEFYMPLERAADDHDDSDSDDAHAAEAEREREERRAEAERAKAAGEQKDRRTLGSLADMIFTRQSVNGQDRRPLGSFADMIFMRQSVTPQAKKPAASSSSSKGKR
eukprot:gnl/TRDRNA2_/TRDRNA2_202154_c0_seq1.p1 gnl/TRDRNA2_/TRDRNA2_202154_c0~~gnl/TRDRNA2_/TRDRNA2_202154_c0_seq1.p1  ORF type:complete len:207 (-),score=33.74 gnl/TRDRNA2_/TRDRNA2_202154_c0_seq1:114-734(-)